MTIFLNKLSIFFFFLNSLILYVRLIKKFILKSISAKVINVIVIDDVMYNGN